MVDAEGMNRKPGFERPPSQQIIRLPVDTVPAALVLVGGEHCDGMLFMPPGDAVTQLFGDGDAFLQLALRDRIRMLARAAISAVTVAAEPSMHDLPEEQRRVSVKLRGGGETVDGELRWVGGRRRAVDCLNEDEPFVVLHGSGVTTYVRKAHIAWVEES